MTDTEANKKIVDEFTQGLFSEGDREAADEYLSVELVIHDPGSAPASARRGAALGLGDELRAAVWAGVCRCVLCLYRADCSRSVSAQAAMRSREIRPVERARLYEAAGSAGCVERGLAPPPLRREDSE